MNRNHFRFILYLSLFLIITGLCLVIRMYGDVRGSSVQPMLLMMFLCFLVGFGLLIALMEWNMTTGEENAAFLERLEVSSHKRKRAMDVDRLFSRREKGVSDEYLRGFAESMDFFVRNYLSDFTEGPTEHLFWQICRDEKRIPGGTVSKDCRKDQYRFFMLYSLMLEGRMTEEEFAKLSAFCPSDETRALLANMLYSDSLMLQMKESVMGMFDEAKREDD